jgi:hypothetical protein
MLRQVYTIRRAFLIPLGIDTFLLLFLLVFSFLQPGSTTERAVFAFFFLPSLYLFLDNISRRITLDDEGIAFQRLWKEKKIHWDGVTHVGGLILHGRVYLLFTTARGFFIASNAYGRFPELTEGLLSHIDPARVEEAARPQAGHASSGKAHIAMAWVAAVLMVGIILMRMMPGMM